MDGTPPAFLENLGKALEEFFCFYGAPAFVIIMTDSMLYKYPEAERESLRQVYETAARDVLAGSIFAGVRINGGDGREKPDVRAIQDMLDAALAYVGRTKGAIDRGAGGGRGPKGGMGAAGDPGYTAGYTAKQTNFLVSLVSELLVKQHPSFSDHLVRFHKHVLSEIGHNDDPEVIDGLLRTLGDVSSKMRALHMTKMTLDTAHVAMRAHLREMTEHLSSTRAEQEMGRDDDAQMPSSGILQDVLDYVDHRLSAYVSALDAKEDEQRLATPVYEVVQQHRVRTLFDLVIDYPESLPALEDLKECIKHTKKYGMLVNDFSSSVMTRLLHPGAATSDIIQHYLSTIRVLKYIEPSGYILDIISKPIQRYLRSRKDAIKNIVLLLTDDDGEDGEGGEGGEGGGHPGSAASLFSSSGMEDSMTGLNQFYESDAVAFASIKTWTPAPLEIADGFVGRGQRGARRRAARGNPNHQSFYRRPSSDTISLLTDIYGTKELFLSAYRSMLAEKLVHKIDFDCTKELKTLELLKIRFGEAALQNAEIMMRDVNDSKRLNAVIHGGKSGRGKTPAEGDAAEDTSGFFSSLRVLVTSDQYWPSISKDDAIDFALPADVEAATALFGRRYHSQKAPRTLKWKKSIGEVCLDLTLGDETIEFNVSPVQATILLAFEGRPEYALAELSEHLKLPEPMLLHNAIFWINEGVMRLEKMPNNVQVLRRNEAITRPMTTMDVDDGEDKDDGVDASLEYLEPFIVGMLTNFDGLPLERIHNMLKMFVTDPPYDRGIDDLSRLLESMVGRGVCVFEQPARLYRRPPE